MKISTEVLGKVLGLAVIFSPLIFVCSLLFSSIVKSTFARKDPVKIEIQVFNALSGFAYTTNKAPGGKMGPSASVIISGAGPRTAQLDDFAYVGEDYGFGFYPESMDGFRIKIYRKNVLCANSYKHFDSKKQNWKSRPLFYIDCLNKFMEKNRSK